MTDYTKFDVDKSHSSVYTGGQLIVDNGNLYGLCRGGETSLETSVNPCSLKTSVNPSSSLEASVI